MCRNYFIFFTSAYLLASVEEWFAHKYIMHVPSSIFNRVYENHKLHHIQTNTDYTIKNGIEYICFDVMTFDGFIQFTVCFLLNTGILYLLFYNDISFCVIYMTVLVFLVANILVWNTIHSYTHGLDAYEICNPKGIPRKYINEKNWYVNLLINNHKAHHYNSTGNYNIVFPGADFLFGSYNTNIR